MAHQRFRMILAYVGGASSPRYFREAWSDSEGLSCNLGRRRLRSGHHRRHQHVLLYLPDSSCARRQQGLRPPRLAGTSRRIAPFYLQTPQKSVSPCSCSAKTPEMTHCGPKQVHGFPVRTPIRHIVPISRI